MGGPSSDVQFLWLMTTIKTTECSHDSSRVLKKPASPCKLSLSASDVENSHYPPLTLVSAASHTFFPFCISVRYHMLVQRPKTPAIYNRRPSACPLPPRPRSLPLLRKSSSIRLLSAVIHRNPWRSRPSSSLQHPPSLACPFPVFCWRKIMVPRGACDV